MQPAFDRSCQLGVVGRWIAPVYSPDLYRLLHASCLSQGTSLAHIICRAGRLVASGHRSFAASRLFSDAAVRRRLPVREHARLKPHRDQLRPAQGFILDAPEPEPPEPVLRPDVASMDMQADRTSTRLN